MALRRYNEGEKVRTWPTRTWDALIDGEQRDAQRAEADPATTGGAQRLGGAHVLVANGTGSDVAAGGVLLLGDPVISPADDATAPYNGPAFAGSAPTGSEASGAAFGVLAAAIAAGDAGEAIVVGAAWAKVTINDADHDYAGLGSSSAALASAGAGPARIVWRAASSGTVWCLVLLGGSSTSVDGAAHVVVPAEVIPAAQRRFSVCNGRGGFTLKPGSGLCYIYERDGEKLCPALDELGAVRTVTVFNTDCVAYDGVAVVAGSGSDSGAPAIELGPETDVLIAVRDGAGDYYATKDSRAGCATSSSSSSSSSSASDSGSGGGGGSGSDSGGGSGGGGSGSGSGGCENGGYTGTFTFVTDVTWDADTCEITVTKQTLTFAAGELCEVT